MSARPPRLRGLGIQLPVPTLMFVEAVSLATMSTLHLSGVLTGGAKSFRRTDAGIAEALICVVLAAGAAGLVRGSRHARARAAVAIVFAILGFLVGLNFTLQGGDTIDVAYHLTLLPLLVITLLVLRRQPTRSHA